MLTLKLTEWKYLMNSIQLTEKMTSWSQLIESSMN